MKQFLTGYGTLRSCRQRTLMPDNAEGAGPTSWASPKGSLLRFVSIGAGATALAGVGGYWSAAVIQCGLQSKPLQVVACPLSSIPVLTFLLTLSVGAILLAITTVTSQGSGRLTSISSAFLVAGAIGFPARGVFTNLAIPPGGLDPMFLATALVVIGGSGGFLVSAGQRRLAGRTNRPYNRLAFGASLIGMVGLEAYWFPGDYAGAVYGVGCPPVGLNCMYIPTPAIPEAAIITLVATAFGVAISIYARRLQLLSVASALSVLVAAVYVWSQVVSDSSPSLGIIMVWIALGAAIALSGSVPDLWAIYVSSKHRSPSPSC